LRLTRICPLPYCLAIFLAAALSPAARAQAPETMLPEQSSAKAKQLIQQTVAALGGPAFLGVRDVDCTGRLSFFGRTNEVTGYDYFRDLWKFPDKNRTEYSKKAEIIEVYNGNQAWTLDKGGVTEKPAADAEEFQEGLKRDPIELLRTRLNEEGMTFRYGGSEIVDLKQVDWVEIVDRERRTFRLALDRATHLPIRSEVFVRNVETRERTELVKYYSNYHAQQGVLTPFQEAHARDGRRIYQVFYNGCAYNTGLSEDLFTRASLEKHYAEFGKKKKK
jgi:outer membrane lipoprotein-sorting protein